MGHKRALPMAIERNKGILLVDKQRGSSSFRLVSLLRKLTGIEKIGHCGTLDPFATGLMVMLIGREFTKRSDEFLTSEKEYRAVVHLGIATDTYDVEGRVTSRSERVPTRQDIEQAIEQFQGEILQIPPMFSAKKIRGEKLYRLARRGIEIERQPVKVYVHIDLIAYEYPELALHVRCSKGTYVRSLAHDLGIVLNTGAHLFALQRTSAGSFRLENAISQVSLEQPGFDITPFLRLTP